VIDAMTTQRAVPEGKYAEIGGGLRIHYHEVGEGKPLLFLHGSGPGASGWSNFRHNFPFLASHGYRCIVADTLGYGYSSKPDDRDYTLDWLVSNVRSFLEVIGVARCSVIGNSHGGAMSMKLAIDHPAVVDKLVLMAPGGLETRETYMNMDGIKAMMKAFFGREGITRETMRRVFELQLFDPSLVTDALLDERVEIANLQPKRVLSSMQVPNLGGDLGKIQCPTFALWGVDDKYCPVSGAMTIATGVPGARVLMLSKCGHWVMVEHAAVFNRLCLDFLQEG
jgi:4,5:9,10-diseco-3-hydroxy-5,9,17-trioxoandrosta-1(10),2-diene-4-oate hydrolase